MAIRIMTDSTSDISREQADDMGISIVPLKVIFGSEEYKEGIDITIEDFYEKLLSVEHLPTTSQPAPDDFLGYFTEAKEAGDSVIVMVIASKLSGTYQSAMIAKEIVDYDKIYIIDSKTTTTSLRLLVDQAVRLRDEGNQAEEIVDKLMDIKERIVLIAMVDTLEYLHKGGRLSKSTAILGTLLRFKPVLTLKDGEIIALGKERGIRKGIGRMIEAIEEFGEVDFDYPLHLGYTLQDDKCKLLYDKLKEKYGTDKMTMFPVGCVIGTHVGPGGCIFTYVRK